MTTYIINALDYLFGFNPPIIFGLQWVVWTFIGLGIALALYLIFVLRTSHDGHLKKLLQDYPSRLITIAFLLLINIFSRFNRIEVLSMRFITFLLIAWMAYCFYQIYHNLMVKLPEKHQQKTVAMENLQKKYHIHKNKGRKTIKR